VLQSSRRDYLLQWESVVVSSIELHERANVPAGSSLAALLLESSNSFLSPLGSHLHETRLDNVSDESQ
jgi:hypothetical protein